MSALSSDTRVTACPRVESFSLVLVLVLDEIESIWQAVTHELQRNEISVSLRSDRWSIFVFVVDRMTFLMQCIEQKRGKNWEKLLASRQISLMNNWEICPCRKTDLFTEKGIFFACRSTSDGRRSFFSNYLRSIYKRCCSWKIIGWKNEHRSNWAEVEMNWNSSHLSDQSDRVKIVFSSCDKLIKKTLGRRQDFLSFAFVIVWVIVLKC